MTLTYDDAKEYVSYVVDDALCGRRLGDDQHAVIREGGDDSLPSRERKGFKYPSVLVGWKWGFESMFVAVHSYLDVRLDDEECEELARDFLAEKGWFSGEPIAADYVLRKQQEEIV